MSILVVSYLPRGERSQTRALLAAFLAATNEPAVEHLDLSEDVPDLFLADNLQAYLARNYGGEDLSQVQRDSLATMDRMTEQLQRADTVVLAFPMFNFSLPAAVKAWFDSVMQKGKTWTMGPKGYRGLLQGRRALILMTAGGRYAGDMAAWEHAVSLARVEFTFMGFDDIRTVTVEGLNSEPEQADQRIAAARNEVECIAREWRHSTPAATTAVNS